MLSWINFFNEQKGKGFFFILGFSTAAAITGHVEKGRWNMQVGKHSPNAVQEWRRKEKGSTITELHTPEGCTISCKRLTVATGFYAHGLPRRAVPCDLQHEQTHAIRHFLWKEQPQISSLIQLGTRNDVYTEKAFVLIFLLSAMTTGILSFQKTAKLFLQLSRAVSTKNHKQGAAVNPLWKLGQTLLF